MTRWRHTLDPDSEIKARRETAQDKVRTGGLPDDRDKEEPCPDCDGSGYDKILSARRARVCSSCNGTGRKEEK